MPPLCIVSRFSKRRARYNSGVRVAAIALAASVASVAAASAAQPVPTPIGVGPAFHPAAASPAVSAGRPVGRLRCNGIRRLQRAHLEIFARGRALIIPRGIGISRARACTYDVRTTAPTGVVEFDASRRLTLGDFFAVWGRRLARDRLLSFNGRVRAYVAASRWRGSVQAIPLTRHAQIVLEVGPYIPPHARFLFGPGR
jgi:hypothetical protein